MLEDKADGLPAVDGKKAVRQPGELLAGNGCPAARRREDTAEDAKQGALARAAGAHQADHAVWRNGQRDIGKGVDLVCPALVVNF